MSQRRSVLIFTNTIDPHTDRVVELLAQQDQPAFRLNTDEVPQNIRFEYRGGVDGPGVIAHAAGHEVDLGSLKSIWIRRPAMFNPPDFDPSATDLNQYFDREWFAAIMGALAAAPCAKVNDHDRATAAEYKLEQLSRAAATGMSVPPTVVSNQPDRIREFVALHRGRDQQVICKVVHPANINVGTKMMRTTAVTDELLEHIDELEQCPMIFQQRIDKAYELRVTVIGSELFAVKIDSQLFDESALDWRIPTVDVPLLPYELPARVAQWCHEFVASYGLHYSAMDFIVTPEGDYVFVENNPSGQFGFLEQVPDYDVFDSMARLLTDPPSS